MPSTLRAKRTRQVLVIFTRKKYWDIPFHRTGISTPTKMYFNLRDVNFLAANPVTYNILLDLWGLPEWIEWRRPETPQKVKYY